MRLSLTVCYFITQIEMNKYTHNTFEILFHLHEPPSMYWTIVDHPIQSPLHTQIVSWPL